MLRFALGYLLLPLRGGRIDGGSRDNQSRTAHALGGTFRGPWVAGFLTSNCGLVVCATLESSDQGTAARTLRKTRNLRQTLRDRSGSDGFAKRSEPVALVTALRFVGYGHLDENRPDQTVNFPDDFHGIVRPNGA